MHPLSLRSCSVCRYSSSTWPCTKSVLPRAVAGTVPGVAAAAVVSSLPCILRCAVVSVLVRMAVWYLLHVPVQHVPVQHVKLPLWNCCWVVTYAGCDDCCTVLLVCL
jgi:hypothetical protein